LADGQIAEQGTYAELMNFKGPFSQLLLEFGGSAEPADGTVQRAVEVVSTLASSEQDITTMSRLSRKHVGRAAGTGKLEVSDDFFL